MKRSLFLIVLIPALAACDAMTAHTDVVARVGQHELTIDEMVELLAINPQIPPQPEVVGSVADLWVDYTLLAELIAEDTALADLDISSMVEPFMERQVFMELRGQVTTADTVVTEEELRAAFAEQAPGLRIRARHILLSYPEGADEASRDSVTALAEELVERARSGEDFAALAREYSQDPGSAQSGGDLGWFQRGRMVEPFENAAFALQPGEVSDVVETPFGLHVIRVEERESPEWDEERGEEFRTQLLNQRRQASLNEYVEALRGPVNIEIRSGAADIARDLAGDPTEQLGSRAASRALVTWDGGELTVREYLTFIRRVPPPQQGQYATAQDEQIENVLRELATNELVLADAEERGITVPEGQRDSLETMILEQLRTMASNSALRGSPQEGETQAEAIERRVRTALEQVLSGQGRLLPLGSLKYAIRDQIDWRIHESTFPEVAEELEQRRSGQDAGPRPPVGGQVPPPAGQQPTQPGDAPTQPQPDTSG